MNAKLSSLLLAGTAAIGISFCAGSAHATAFTGVCPSTLGQPAAGGGGVGSAGGCTVGISINSTSLVINTGTAPNSDTGLFTNTTGTGLPLAYESVEDVLVGVVNTGSGRLGGVTLTGTGIGGFDGDGICQYVTGGNKIACNNNTLDTSNGKYGGPDTFFTSVSANSVTANFEGGIGPGGSTFFSLEEPTSGGICTTPTSCPHFAAPEPASMALLGTGLFGLAALRRRRRKS